MTSRIQVQRLSTTGTAPGSGTRPPGELWLNLADYSLGMINQAQAPVELLPIRVYVPTAGYATGDIVVNGGQLLQARTPLTPHTFNAGEWNVFQTTTQLDVHYDARYAALYLPLAGGTLTGLLTLSGPPTAPLHAATKAYAETYADTHGVQTFNGRNGAVTLNTADVRAVADTTYVNVIGDRIVGDLTVDGAFTVGGSAMSVGGWGITYPPLGGHYFGFDWDGTFIVGHVDGTGVPGQLANVSWVNANFYPAGTTDTRYVFKTGDLMSGSLNINPGNLTVPSGFIECQGSRIISVGASNNPSVAVHNTSVSYAAGIWCAGAGALQFGSCDGAGVPNATHGYLDAAHLGFSTGGSIAIATYGGAASVLFGNNTDFNVPGNAWKPGGGLWADSSDARIKNVIDGYYSGLDAILALRPIRYTLKNNWHRGDDMQPPHDAVDSTQEFIGLIAQEAEIPMPEMVSRISAVIDDVPVDDLRTLDMTALPLALVNAVKELDARLRAVEGLIT